MELEEEEVLEVKLRCVWEVCLRGSWVRYFLRWL